MLVVDVSTVDGITCNEMRLAWAEKGIHALTVKNTLARKALERKGVAGLDGVLDGPSTLVYGGEDIVALSKEITKWAKEIDQLSIKGGHRRGPVPWTRPASKPSPRAPAVRELLATIVAQILSPGANLSAALLGPAKLIASQVKQIADGEAGPNKTA